MNSNSFVDNEAAIKTTLLQQHLLLLQKQQQLQQKQQQQQQLQLNAPNIINNGLNGNINSNSIRKSPLFNSTEPRRGSITQLPLLQSNNQYNNQYSNNVNPLPSSLPSSTKILDNVSNSNIFDQSPSSNSNSISHRSSINNPNYNVTNPSPVDNEVFIINNNTTTHHNNNNNIDSDNYLNDDYDDSPSDSPNASPNNSVYPYPTTDSSPIPLPITITNNNTNNSNNNSQTVTVLGQFVCEHCGKSSVLGPPRTLDKKDPHRTVCRPRYAYVNGQRKRVCNACGIYFRRRKELPVIKDGNPVPANRTIHRNSNPTVSTTILNNNNNNNNNNVSSSSPSPNHNSVANFMATMTNNYINSLNTNPTINNTINNNNINANHFNNNANTNANSNPPPIILPQPNSIDMLSSPRSNTSANSYHSYSNSISHNNNNPNANIINNNNGTRQASAVSTATHSAQSTPQLNTSTLNTSTGSIGQSPPPALNNDFVELANFSRLLAQAANNHGALLHMYKCGCLQNYLQNLTEQKVNAHHPVNNTNNNNHHYHNHNANINSNNSINDYHSAPEPVLYANNNNNVNNNNNNNNNNNIPNIVVPNARVKRKSFTVNPINTSRQSPSHSNNNSMHLIPTVNPNANISIFDASPCSAPQIRSQYPVTINNTNNNAIVNNNGDSIESQKQYLLQRQIELAQHAANLENEVRLLAAKELAATGNTNVNNPNITNNNTHRGSKTSSTNSGNRSPMASNYENRLVQNSPSKRPRQSVDHGPIEQLQLDHTNNASYNNNNNYNAVNNQNNHHVTVSNNNTASNNNFLGVSQLYVQNSNNSNHNNNNTSQMNLNMDNTNNNAMLLNNMTVPGQNTNCITPDLRPLSLSANNSHNSSSVNLPPLEILPSSNNQSRNPSPPPFNHHNSNNSMMNPNNSINTTNTNHYNTNNNGFALNNSSSSINMPLPSPLPNINLQNSLSIGNSNSFSGYFSSGFTSPYPQLRALSNTNSNNNNNHNNNTLN